MIVKKGLFNICEIVISDKNCSEKILKRLVAVVKRFYGNMLSWLHVAMVFTSLHHQQLCHQQYLGDIFYDIVM